MARETDFVSEYRQTATDAIKALQHLQILHREAVIMDYPNALTDAAFAGENSVIDAVKLQAVMNAANGLFTLLTAEVLRSFYTVRV